MGRRAMRAALLALLLAVAACGAEPATDPGPGAGGTAGSDPSPAAGQDDEEGTVEADEQEGPVATVVEGTVADFGELRIGAGEVGARAVLVMLDGPETLVNTTLRVGAPVEHDGYTVELVEADRDARTAVLRVTDPQGRDLP